MIVRQLFSKPSFHSTRFQYVSFQVFIVVFLCFLCLGNEDIHPTSTFCIRLQKNQVIFLVYPCLLYKHPQISFCVTAAAFG